MSVYLLKSLINRAYMWKNPWSYLFKIKIVDICKLNRGIVRKRLNFVNE